LISATFPAAAASNCGSAIKLVIGYSLHDHGFRGAATSEHRAITSSFSAELIIPRAEITFAAVLSGVSKSRPARFIDQPAQPFHCA
jgi:hypothetical protein